MMLLLKLLIVPGTLGFLAAAALTRGSDIKLKALFLSSVSLPLGLGICSLLLYFTYLSNVGHPRFFALTASCIAITALVFLNFFSPRTANSLKSANAKFRIWLSSKHDLKLPNFNKISFKSLLTKALFFLCLVAFAATLFYFLYSFISFSVWNVFGGWDARYHWNLKARFLHRAPEYWRLIFSSNIAPDVENYPLFLPASIAWGWNLAGQEVLIWPPLIALCFSLSLAAFILWYVSSYVHPIAGLVITAFYFMNPVYQFWGASQYADVPLCFFITSGAACLLISIRNQKLRFSLIAGILAGLSFWLKNEGGLFSVACFTAMALVYLFDKSVSSEFKIKHLLLFLSGLLIPLLATLYLKLFLAPADIFSRHGQGLNHLLASFSDLNKTLFIAAAFYSFKINGFKFDNSVYSWCYLWQLFAFAFLYAALFRRKVFTEHKLWIFLLVIAMMETGYFVIFHITPIKLTFHLQTALHRLLLHNGILALIFAFEAVDLPGRVTPPKTTFKGLSVSSSDAA